MNKITLANRYHDRMYRYMNNQPVGKEEFTYFDGKQVDVNSVGEEASIPSGTSVGDEKMNSTNIAGGKTSRRSADQDGTNDYIANAGLDSNRRSRGKNNGMRKCNNNDKDNGAYNNGTSSSCSNNIFEEQKTGSTLSGKNKKNDLVSSSYCDGLGGKAANDTGLGIPIKGNDNHNTVVRAVSSGNAGTDIVADSTIASVMSCHKTRTDDVRSGKVVPNFRGSIYGEMNLDGGINYHSISYESIDRHVDNGEDKSAQVLNERAFEERGTNLDANDNANLEHAFTNNFNRAQLRFSDEMDDLCNIRRFVNNTNSNFEKLEHSLTPFDQCANRGTHANSEKDGDGDGGNDGDGGDDNENDDEEEDVKKGGLLLNMPSCSFSTYYKSDTVEGGTTSSDVKEVSPNVGAVYDCGNPCGAERRCVKQWKRDSPVTDNKGNTSIDCGDTSGEEELAGSSNGEMSRCNISDIVNQNNNVGIGKESSNSAHRNSSVGSKNRKGNRGNRNKQQNRKGSKRKNSTNKAETRVKGAHSEVRADENAANDANDTNDTNDTIDTNDANDSNDSNQANNVNGPCAPQSANTTSGANKKAQKNRVMINQNSFPAQNDRNNSVQALSGVDDLVNLATMQNCANSSRGSPVDSSNASTMKSVAEDLDLIFFRENEDPLEEHYMLLEEDDYGVQKGEERSGKKDTLVEKDIAMEKDIAGLNNTFNILRNNLYHIFSDSCDEQCSDEYRVDSLDGDADRSRNRGSENVSFVDKHRGDTHRSDMQQGPMQSALGQKGLAQIGLTERSLMERGFIERGLMEQGLMEHELTQHGLAQRVLTNQWFATQPPLYEEDAEEEDRLGINDLRGDKSAFRGQHPLSDAPYSGLLQAPCMSSLMGNVPYAPSVREIVPHNRYGLSSLSGVNSIGMVSDNVMKNTNGHSANGAHQSPFIHNHHNRTNLSAAAGKNCEMEETHQNSRLNGNAVNGKENGNSHRSKKIGNENMIIERPVTLNNSQMLEAFMQGRLCLSCDSLDHPMPLCPNNSFVCPNCHNISHRGNDCPMKCRFCLKYHVGISIMDCLKKARIQSEKNCSNEEKNETNRVGKNVKSNEDRVSVGPRFDITTRPDNSYGRSVYVSNLTEDITNVQLRDAINNNLENGYVVNIDRQDGYAFVELSNLNSTFQLVQKCININFRKLKIQFKKTGQFLIPDNLSLNMNNLVTLGLQRGGAGGATLVQSNMGKNATNAAMCRKNPSNGVNGNALSSGSGATSGNAVEVCTKLRLVGSKGGSNNCTNGGAIPGDGKGKYACKSTSAKCPKVQQQKKQQGKQTQEGQLQPLQMIQLAQTTESAQAAQPTQTMQLVESAQSVQQRKNRHKDNLKQGRAVHTNGASSVDKNPSVIGAILSQKKSKLVGEKNNQEKGRRGRISDGTLPTMSNGGISYDTVGEAASFLYGFKNPHSVGIPSAQVLNLPNGHLLLAQHLDCAKMGTVAEGLNRNYYDFICTNGQMMKTINVNNMPRLPALCSTGAGNGANDIYKNEVADVGLLYEGSKIPLKMANDMNGKNELHKSMTTETNKTTATTTTSSDNMLSTQLFNGGVSSPMGRSLNKFDDMMKETHLSTVMEASGGATMNEKLTRCLNASLQDGMFTGGTMSLSHLADMDRRGSQFSGGAYLGPYNDRFTPNVHNDHRYRTNSGDNNNTCHSTHNSNVSDGRPNIDLKSIVNNAIEVNQDVLNYDQVSFANAAGEGLLHNDVPASAGSDAPGAYTLGKCDVSGPCHSNENYTGQNKMYTDKQAIVGPYMNFEASMNGNNIWKDRSGGSGSGVSGGNQRHSHLKHSYNNICDDMFFANHDMYDVFSRFNAIKVDDDRGGSGRGSGNVSGTIGDGVGHPFAVGTNQHNDGCNQNTKCGHSAVHQVPSLPNEATDGKNKIKFVNLSPNTFQQLSNLHAKEDVDLMDDDSYVSSMKYKELDAIEKDLEKHIKALWNLRKIKLVKTHDITQPHNGFV
ncbi:hypothetical protein AK88_02966 [Plasmodium fragile]|uniref:RRM domain-containing protein n=1 Tax=Plasmodium fragile TaxID=5857 RepID=A0A0D9QK49_PLAFR|nr:uncharacterized protein AK88_02966 [Plasmodium fragile]KJP87409.1 hypothetical protein AK88_02966 [Plasmodium fragile]